MPILMANTGPTRSPSYIGPGDIVGGAIAWYGLRSYSRAKIGSNCVDIVRASDSAVQTFVTVWSGGVDVVSIVAFLAATTGKITKKWDQTGYGNHMTQGTDANRPALTLNGIGSLPIITFASGNNLSITGGAFHGGVDISQPYTANCVFNDTGTGILGTLFVSGDSGGANKSGLYVDNSAPGQALMYAGTINQDPITLGVWNTISGIFNDPSATDFNVNGVPDTSFHAGTNAWFANQVYMGRDVPSAVDPFVGKIVEAGVWPVPFTATNSSNLSANQHAYWGF